MTRDKPAQNGVKHIVLVGAMGAGKTTVGRELADRLGRPFLDSDSQLERVHDQTGAQIASRDGVERLHAIELETFLDMVESETTSVLSPAASVVDSERGRELLNHNLTIWLDAAEDVLAERRSTDDHRRSIDEDEVVELQRRRRPHWQELAAIRIDTSRPVAETVDELVSEIRRRESPERHQKVE